MAVLRFTGAEGSDGTPADACAVPSEDGAAASSPSPGTWTFMASSTRAARFSEEVSAPSTRPPAASTASATRGSSPSRE